MIFRRSEMKDIDQMVRIAEEGKALLREKGVSQWQRGTYPDRALFEQDVRNGIGYVAAEGDEVLAICAVTFTEEEAYRTLLSGQWKTPEGTCYATIHRSAVARARQGNNISGFLFSSTAELARRHGAVSIRIDTHPDNLTMQKTLARAGFEKCGELILPDGDEAGDLRFGYELLI